MRLTDLLSLLWQRKLPLLLAAMVAGVLGFVAAKALPVRFSSEGLLLVEARDQTIPELNQTAAAQTPGMQRIRTEADILRSRQLSADVVRELGLDEKPEKEGIGAAIGALIAPVTDWVTNIVASLSSDANDDQVPGAAPLDKVSMAVEQMQKNLSIGTTENSNVVVVRYTADTAEEGERQARHHHAGE
jgi:polysaccharide biosynthesis transport protein